MTRTASEQHRTTSKRNIVSSLVRKLAQQHDPPQVRAALLRCWIKANRVSAAQVRHCQQTQVFLDSISPSQWEPLCDHLSVQPDLSLKDLESGLESLNGTAKRRQQGIVYTPVEIIDYLLETAVDQTGPSAKAPLICDPACGSGGFLLRAARMIGERYSLTFDEALRGHVVGIDRDRESLDNARCLIELALAQRGQSVPADEVKLICCDSLTTPARDIHQLAGADDGFDIVASNPPYVKLQNLELAYRRVLEDHYRDFVKGSYSLALLFMIAGHRMLKTAGCLAYVTQNNLFTSLAGEPIRQYLGRHRYLRRILDFGPRKVFGQASAYACLVFLGTERSDHVQYAFSDEQPTRGALSRLDYSPIPSTRLDPKKWRLAKPHHLDNIERIERAGRPLGALTDIRVGFATLKDSVFLVRDMGDRCLAAGPEGEEIFIEREITRPAVKVADVTMQEELVKNDARVIFPYRARGAGFALLGEDELRTEFPLAYAHLSACREILGRRDKGQSKAEAWYAWGRSQGRQADGPKLLTRTFDRSPRFLLDRSDQLFCNGYSVTLRADAAPWLSIELLQTILNSPVMHYYAKLTSFQIAGGYQCFQKNFIERFGIPPLEPDAKSFLQLTDAARGEQIVGRYGLPQSEIEEVLSR